MEKPSRNPGRAPSAGNGRARPRTPRRGRARADGRARGAARSRRRTPASRGPGRRSGWSVGRRTRAPPGALVVDPADGLRLGQAVEIAVDSRVARRPGPRRATVRAPLRTDQSLRPSCDPLPLLGGAEARGDQHHDGVLLAVCGDGPGAATGPAYLDRGGPAPVVSITQRSRAATTSGELPARLVGRPVAGTLWTGKKFPSTTGGRAVALVRASLRACRPPCSPQASLTLVHRSSTGFLHPEPLVHKVIHRPWTASLTRAPAAN